MSTAKPEQAQQEEKKHQQKEQQQSQQLQQEEKEKAGHKCKEAEVAEIMNPDDLFQLLLRDISIPKAAYGQWRNLGLELDLSGDDLQLIEQDVQQNPVVSSATKMLEDWLQARENALAEDLITAIDRIGLKALAATLKKEYDPKKKLTHRDLRNIIPSIATRWRDIAIELAVKNFDIYAQNSALTEEKFKRMLQLWLNVNDKPVDELCEIFREGLRGINLNAAAKEFKENYEKFKTKEALKKLA